MSTESANFSDRLINNECPENLAIAPPAESGSELWTEIHAEVQGILEALDELVRSRVPALRVTAGRTQGRSFFLFTHRTFSRTDVANIDPVVVGLTFAPAQNEAVSKAVIDADISGECTGDGIETLTRRVVAATREELLRAARQLAQELAGHSQVVAEALLEVSRGA
jgi:hypothetical protein